MTKKQSQRTPKIDKATTMKSIISLGIAVSFAFCLSSCGGEPEGTYHGTVNGKLTSIEFLNQSKARLSGFFPEELEGSWKKEDFLDRQEIWVTFEGPEEKPFRLRFELLETDDGLMVKGVKSRPIGKGMQLAPLQIEGKPILKR